MKVLSLFDGISCGRGYCKNSRADRRMSMTENEALEYIKNMADRMEFPNTMKEFIDGFSFKDSEEVYTNGAELIPVFRVEQGFEHYAKEIRAKAIDEFAERLKDLIAKNVEDAENSNDLCCEIFQSEIDEIEEQLKVGGVEWSKK